ncbi:MAG: ATP-dependent DNA helicase [Mycobacteriaceae bacterium]
MSLTPAIPSVTELLSSAVQSLGGKERSGQVAMAAAVSQSMDTGEHLAVQAGTGTGKSLAYLVPAIRQAVLSGRTVVVSTATIALQQQLINRDLPRLVEALAASLPRKPEFAILKGRNNYLCMNKIHTGAAEETPESALFDAFTVSRLGREVQRLTHWSSETENGDRDELNPGVSEQAWRQVSVSARECLGLTRCPVGADCFAERAKASAARVDVVVTNHALLAIHAISDITVLPEHNAVVIDEAHELVDRVTSVATEELSPTNISIAARRCIKLIEDEDVDRLEGAGEALGLALESLQPGRWESMPEGFHQVFASLRDAAWAARTAIGPPRPGLDPEAAAARSTALTAVEDIHDTAVRILSSFAESDTAKRRDVVWFSREETRNSAREILRVAPLSVGGLLRARLFAESTVILTSATLTVGGSFDALAVSWGLPPGGSLSRSDTTMATAIEPQSDSASIRWNALDVGSPFNHEQAGILYIAKHLPAPGRDGLSEVHLAEITDLITAAQGRTLGLYSSMRGAKAAAEAMRERLNTPVLCQGDDSTAHLVQRFADDPATSLFGTLSLWQGVDVPGPSLSLVIIDRIPFPRPDDPLLAARQRAVESRGGNGFMTIAAGHAALLLAQGVGRLLRSVDDKGVVAVLDSRLVTARYGGFLRASLPPFWETTDPKIVRKALSRL